MTEGNDAGMAGQPGAGGGNGEGGDALAFDIDEQPPIPVARRLPFEQIDMVVTGFPKPQTRRLPLSQRLRVLWHRQVPDGARR
jgi:hypothetical protein